MTLPARSEPSVRGSGCGKALLPVLIQPSHGPTPTASTLTRTTPGLGSGRGIRSNLMTSGGPYSCTRQAIIDGEGCCAIIVIPARDLAPSNHRLWDRRRARSLSLLFSEMAPRRDYETRAQP